MQGRGLKHKIVQDLKLKCRSPLMQGRGLKHNPKLPPNTKKRSPLMQGRGLKPVTHCCIITNRHVAPYAGAWIETSNDRLKPSAAIVAPYAGAWIET